MIFGAGFASALALVTAMFWFGERIARWAFRPNTDLDWGALDLLIAKYDA